MMSQSKDKQGEGGPDGFGGCVMGVRSFPSGRWWCYLIPKARAWKDYRGPASGADSPGGEVR
jgi:hypothetical protein